MTKRTIDFSTRPGPRYRSQGEFSGEEFFEKCLNEWFCEARESGRTLRVVLDGTDGYLSSFIDEAFGRLVYTYGIDEVNRILELVSDEEPVWKSKLADKTFPAWQERREKGEAPRMTQSVAGHE